ncbi:DUF1015 domain-containing protein [Nocardiopsis lambiniae]|uniref:DUF1015 domain-containing protein n=1 Tax=Nocardiopsis lambiniae TaxID=3075539 RepID=A0ABU2MCJ7_9ACTN|nr:DUF1015 domain-containing protein [Nocardiopsis sp. DSM 44743]MDT0330322.1 DUF1015 domain-containing protein [Nocardiopsis sp. DSM 44743]
MPRQPLELAPFRGLRYANGDLDRFIDGEFDLARLLAPPYDVPDAEEARALQRSDPHNAARVTLPFELSRHSTAGTEGTVPRRYRAAAALLHDWVDTGVLALDPLPALYVYEQVTADGRRQRGLIGDLRLPEDGDPPAVLPHEDVADAPVHDRFTLMRVARANLEPIFLLYRGAGGTASITTETVTDPPLVETRTRDGAEHRLWAITDPDVHTRVAADLADRSALIADGHHRYAAYRRLRAAHSDPGWRHGLALLVDSDTHPPRLGAIHRVLPGLRTEDAIAAALTVAAVETVDRPSAHAFDTVEGPALLLASPEGDTHLVHDFDENALARAMPDRSPSWRHLPTAALHEVLLPLWGISEEAVRMVHDDPAEAVAAAHHEKGTAVIVPALDVHLVYEIAAQGEPTPRKSTSFGPKPRTGLVMRLLDTSDR